MGFERRSFWRHSDCLLESFCLIGRGDIMKNHHRFPIFRLISETMLWIFCFCIHFRAVYDNSRIFLVCKWFRFVLMRFNSITLVFRVIGSSNYATFRFKDLAFEVRFVLGSLTFFCFNSHWIVVFPLPWTCVIEIQFVLLELVSNVIADINLDNYEALRFSFGFWPQILHLRSWFFWIWWEKP